MATSAYDLRSGWVTFAAVVRGGCDGLAALVVYGLAVSPRDSGS